MINFSFIERIFGVNNFNKLLWDRIYKAFNLSFKRTNESFYWKSQPSKAVLDYFKQRELILSEKTMSRVTGDIKYEILEGIENRESITELTNRLDKVFDGERWQIERIARTEVLNAQNAGEFHAQLSSNVAKWKMWKANVNNKRTAADSLRLHNQIQKIKDPFVDPKTGKESMHSPNRPNCRCSIVYLFELPKNIIYKKGIMYNDYAIQKGETTIELLQKAEKRIWIKPTAKRIGHYRKIRGAKPKKESNDEMLKLPKLVKMYIEKLKNNPEIIREIRNTKNLIESGHTSKIDNQTPDGKYTLERKTLHNKIIKNIFGDTKPSDKPEVIFIGGGPGSGKSNLINKIQNLNNYIYLNNDEIKKEFPEYSGSNSAYYHEEARDICIGIREKAKKLKMNIILDATMRDFDKSIITIENFKSLGYSTKLLSTNLPVEEALNRAVNRTISGEKRFVPLSFIAEVMEPTNENQFKYLKYVDSGQIFNTNVKRGDDFILMEKKE